MKQDNRIVVDLRKVQWARFYYVNQYGQQIDVLPYCKMTYKLRPIDEAEYMFPTSKDLIKRNKVLVKDWLREKGYEDKWIPTLKLKLTANESLIYTNNKAKSIWKEWNRRQFTKK